jgi:preprotein translocase SecE subunit
MKENSKQERMNPVFAYLVEAVEEFKKVTWPTKEQAIMLTSVVIGVTAVTALLSVC